MAIDPNIKEKTKYIRDEPSAMKVRDSIADGLDLMSEDVEATKQRQMTVEETFQMVIDETTDKDIISAPEIIAARGNHDNLSQRLLSTDQQLAQIITVNVKDYGAKGDGITNDTKAFQRASRVIQDHGGGRMLIPKGIYLVGEQELAGAPGKGFSYKSDDIISVDGFGYFEIQGNDATIITNPDLKYGSFDPTTGLVHNPELPFFDTDYKAEIGTIISAKNGDSLVINNLKLDGSNESLSYGGLWGDKGRQIRGYGIRTDRIEKISMLNVKSNYHALDGLMVTYEGLNPQDSSKPVTLINVETEYNGRQGFTLAGGKGLTVINSKFNKTGRGGVATSPAAGLDIEAEGSVVRDAVFINCEFGDNVGAGMVAESGDSADVLFFKCKFYGTTSASIWPNRPKFKFLECTINGYAESVYNAQNEDDRTLFSNCEFNDYKLFEGKTPYGETLADFYGRNPIFNNCKFMAKSGKKLQSTSSRATYRNCYFHQKGNTGVATPQGKFEGANEMVIETGSVDLSGSTNYGMFPTTGTITAKPRRITEPANDLKLINSNGTFYKINTIQYLNRMPTTGNWIKGDTVYNNEPEVGLPRGWVCVISGSPGIWKSFDPVQN